MRDFADELRQFYHQGIVGIAPQGQLFLAIPVKDALAIAIDDTIGFPKAALLCWLLESRSELDGTANCKAPEVADAIKKLRRRMGAIYPTR